MSRPETVTIVLSPKRKWFFLLSFRDVVQVHSVLRCHHRHRKLQRLFYTFLIRWFLFEGIVLLKAFDQEDEHKSHNLILSLFLCSFIKISRQTYELQSEIKFNNVLPSTMTSRFAQQAAAMQAILRNNSNANPWMAGVATRGAAVLQEYAADNQKNISSWDILAKLLARFSIEASQTYRGDFDTDDVFGTLHIFLRRTPEGEYRLSLNAAGDSVSIPGIENGGELGGQYRAFLSHLNESRLCTTGFNPPTYDTVKKYLRYYARYILWYHQRVQSVPAFNRNMRTQAEAFERDMVAVLFLQVARQSLRKLVKPPQLVIRDSRRDWISQRSRDEGPNSPNAQSVALLFNNTQDHVLRRNADQYRQFPFYANAEDNRQAACIALEQKWWKTKIDVGNNQQVYDIFTTHELLVPDTVVAHVDVNDEDYFFFGFPSYVGGILLSQAKAIWWQTFISFP